MPVRTVIVTLCSIAAIMVGGILAVVGLLNGPVVLAWCGIALAAIGFLAFLVEFIRVLRANKKNK